MPKPHSGLLTESKYDAPGRLKSQWTLNSRSQTVRHFEYEYDGQNNLVKRHDFSREWNATEEFSYDLLDRLVRSNLRKNDDLNGLLENNEERWEYDILGIYLNFKYLIY